MEKAAGIIPKGSRRAPFATARGIALILLLAFSVASIAITVVFVDFPVAVTLVSAAGVSLAAGLLVSLRPRPAHVHGAQQVNFAHRLDALTAALRLPSREIDRVLNELNTVAAERKDAIDELSTRLSGLIEQEEALQKRNELLLKVPVPAALVIASINAESEKRSVQRDYVLFGLGVMVSTFISGIFFILQR